MNAICENCKVAVSVSHTRGTKLKECACPFCRKPGLLYAVGVGYDDTNHDPARPLAVHQGRYLYQARSKPELKFPISIPEMRCECGKPGRWHGERNGLRVFGCDDCAKAQLSKGAPNA